MHLRDVVRDELMMHDNPHADSEGWWLHGLRLRDGSLATVAPGMSGDGGDGIQDMSFVDEGIQGVGGNTTAVVEMSGGEGPENERERERERIVTVATWRDMIDHALGWRGLEA